MPGIWSAVFLDDDLKEPTEIEFLVWSKKHAISFTPNTIKEDEVIDDSTVTAFVDAIRKKKVSENHHSVESIKGWIKSIYQLSSLCHVQNGSCQSNNWSSRSPDSKSNINFEL